MGRGEESVIVTRHAEQRTRERLGLNKSTVKKNTEKALEFGLNHSEAKGQLNEYLNYLYLRHPYSGANIRVYNRHVYIFQGTKLITVIGLPTHLVGLADKLQQRKANQITSD